MLARWCRARTTRAATWSGCEAPQRLVVLGAGDDAKPLVRMAAGMGWSVMVADGRAQLARAERFPEAAVRCDRQNWTCGAATLSC